MVKKKNKAYEKEYIESLSSLQPLIIVVYSSRYILYIYKQMPVCIKKKKVLIPVIPGNKNSNYT